MMFYNDLSAYNADNILRNSPDTAHSGPELAPKTIFADTLAREVVLDKVHLVSSERPAMTSAYGADHSMKVRVSLL